MTIAIYALTDPRDGRVRYVGRSRSPAARARSHQRPHTESRRKRDWIAELRSVGLEPGLLILERCADDKFPSREREWISRYRTLGALLNVRSGDRDGTKIRSPAQTEPLAVRVDSDELLAWKRAAEQVAEESHAHANVSALIRKAMAAEMARLKKAADRDRAERKGGR